MKRRSFFRGIALMWIPMIAMAIATGTESLVGLVPCVVMGLFWDKLVVWAAEDVS